MRYFDNEFLKQYLQQGRDLMVFVNGKPLNIADESDLADKKIGVGYDGNGKDSKFHYKDIQYVKSGAFTLDLKGLNKALDNKDIGGDEEPAAAPASKKPEEGGAEENPFAAGGAGEEEEGGEGEEALAESFKGRFARVYRGPYRGLRGIITEIVGSRVILRTINTGESWNIMESVDIERSKIDYI